jgi:hypothetical protein
MGKRDGVKRTPVVRPDSYLLRGYDPYIYWLSRKAEIKAETERLISQCPKLGPFLRGDDPHDLGRWATIDDVDPMTDWLRHPEGPPPNEPDNWYLPGSPTASSDYRDRGFFSKLHGTEARPGPKPKGEKARAIYDKDGAYLGYEPGTVGRPRKPNKFSNAEKQKAYRERKAKRKSRS